MKIITFIFSLLILFFAFTSSALAVYVNGYYKSNGTYVEPYYRSSPNGLKYDNYSWNWSQPLYNDSYGKYNTYEWNTPSWNWESDYFTGLDSYSSNNYYNGWFSTPSYSWGSSYLDW